MVGPGARDGDLPFERRMGCLGMIASQCKACNTNNCDVDGIMPPGPCIIHPEFNYRSTRIAALIVSD